MNSAAKIFNLVFILHCLMPAKIWIRLRIMGKKNFLVGVVGDDFFFWCIGKYALFSKRKNVSGGYLPLKQKKPSFLFKLGGHFFLSSHPEKCFVDSTKHFSGCSFVWTTYGAVRFDCYFRNNPPLRYVVTFNIGINLTLREEEIIITINFHTIFIVALCRFFQ